MRKIAIFAVMLVLALVGLATTASAQAADPDTNGSQPGTHTVIVNNPYNGARLVVYYHRELTSSFPWSDYQVVVDLAVSQDVVPGIQSHRIVMLGQSGAGADILLLKNSTDTGTGPTVGQVGGWDDFRTSGGNAPVSGPVVVVQAQQGQAPGDGPFLCTGLGVVIDGTDNTALSLGCNP